MNYDPMPRAERVAHFRASGVEPARRETRTLELTGSDVRSATSARAAYFQAKAAAARMGAPIKPAANRFAGRDAADHARQAHRKSSPVFVTAELIRALDARR